MWKALRTGRPPLQRLLRSVARRSMVWRNFPPPCARHPAGAENHHAAPLWPAGLFPGPFAGAIGALRVRRVCFRVGRVLGSIKRIVGRKCDQGAQPLRFFAEHARGMGVHGHGQSGLGFLARSTAVWAAAFTITSGRARESGCAGPLAWKGRIATGPAPAARQRRQGALQLKSHLAVFAGQQNTHQLTSY